jgi:phosphatidylglycerol:prolipoprotein diacylglycerol transferase
MDNLDRRVARRFDPRRPLGQLKFFVHPIAFQLGPLTITWYGVMVATAFLLGLWTASRRGLSSGISAEKILDLGPWLIVGTIVGARTLYVVSYWHEQFAGQPIADVFKVWRGGLVYYGGLVGAALAGVLYARIKGLPLWKLADVLAPSIALGSVFGRIGCLLNGCCYGRECDLPWAIHFPPGHQTYPHGVHPTEVYDSLLNLMLYLGLAWLYRRKKFDGEVFATYLIGYALFRSFVEMFRGDYPQHYLGGWATPAQLVSIGILILGVVLWVVLQKTMPRPARGGG